MREPPKRTPQPIPAVSGKPAGPVVPPPISAEEELLREFDSGRDPAKARSGNKAGEAPLEADGPEPAPSQFEDSPTELELDVTGDDPEPGPNPAD